MGFLKNIFTKGNEPLPPISSKEFKVAVKEYFAPQLRKEGWKGTGFDFYKNESPLFYVLSFIPNKYGGSFYIEIGIHYSFITDIEGLQFNSKKLKTYELDFRRRLKDEDNNVEWQYPSDIESCSDILDQIWGTLETDGTCFFHNSIRMVNHGCLLNHQNLIVRSNTLSMLTLNYHPMLGVHG
ncbi:MAG: DUF4304 domain-containing protein [Crocinitomicaceae bacterium]|nr:DUF4304 domain-containing protein [Flavobacteriales bacterium]NQZ35065.1 DUF4304 domain-containing protein [Crocinitomicaceae bacterium]